MNLKQTAVFVLTITGVFSAWADIRLSGVTFSQKGPAALINGELYPVGGEVDGFTVVAIDKQSATLQKISTGEQTVLLVGEASDLPAADKKETKHELSWAFVSGAQDDSSSAANEPTPAIEAVQAALAAGITTAMAVWAGLMLLLDLLMLVAWWKICSKAGQPGWSIFIPFYNVYVMLKVAGKPGWWMLLLFIPIVNIIPAILMPVGIAQNFGKGAGFAIGLIFLPVVFIPLLAFGSAEYQYG